MFYCPICKAVRQTLTCQVCTGSNGELRRAYGIIEDQTAEINRLRDILAEKGVPWQDVRPSRTEVKPCPSCGSTNPNECQHDCFNAPWTPPHSCYEGHCQAFNKQADRELDFLAKVAKASSEYEAGGKQ